MEEVQSQQPRPGPPKEKMRPIKPEEQALMDELILLQEQYGEQFPTICSFVRKESDRIQKGLKSAEEEKTLDIEGGKPIKLSYKVTIPTEKYPEFNYVGRLLGPKGSTLRGMQEISGCKLAVLGRGSMRDKEKEEQCRQEGGKYEHLNENLHLWMSAFGTPDMAFYKLYVACKEVKKYLQADYNDEIFTEQMARLEAEGGLPKGYTAARANMRGGRGASILRGFPSPRGRGFMPRGSPQRGMRGMRGGRGVMPGQRGGRGGWSGPQTNNEYTDTMYEDVYEPATSQAYSANGSQSQGNYFEEFPEPGEDMYAWPEYIEYGAESDYGSGHSVRGRGYSAPPARGAYGETVTHGMGRGAVAMGSRPIAGGDSSVRMVAIKREREDYGNEYGLSSSMSAAVPKIPRRY